MYIYCSFDCVRCLVLTLLVGSVRFFLQQAFLQELEKTVALLVFEDASNCPVKDLLDISHRLKTASEVNAAILTSQSHEKGKLSMFSFVYIEKLLSSPYKKRA